MIILDSSPLIHLTKFGKMDYILNTFDIISIPDAVFNEVVEEGIKNGYSDAILIKNYISADKIRMVSVKKHDPLLQNYLHPGEYESILLANELKTIVVLDDKKASLIAEQRNIPFISTADLILLLLKLKSINSGLYRENLNKYASQGWFSPQIFQIYLKAGQNYE